MSARQKLTAQFIGTFALVFAGTGAIVIHDAGGRHQPTLASPSPSASSSPP